MKNISDIKKGHDHNPLLFPKGFVWGTATSAHQVEGGNTNNDWCSWEQVKGHIANGDVSGSSTNHYELFDKDFDLAKKFGSNAHRLSIEWARLEPEEGKWDENEIEHYRKVFKALKKRRIKIMLTLNHFTLPMWVALKGGWTNKKNVARYQRFVERVIREYGNDIEWWITINEPVVYVTMSYIMGAWPPGKKSFLKAFKSFINLIRAHRSAYKTIHRVIGKNAKVGLANNIISLMSYGTDSWIDYAYVRIIDYIWNHAVYVFTKGYHDFLGVNYYFHQRIERKKGAWSNILVDVRHEKRERSDMGWEIYPHGIFEAVGHLKRYNLPIYITENGIAALNDDKRLRFIVGHLKELYHAIQSGIDIRGYFYWSLLDNFEWDKGFYPRFGIIGVDYATMKRAPRKSAYMFAEIAKRNGIEHKHLTYLGHKVGSHTEHVG